jgi:hypothetical protein
VANAEEIESVITEADGLVRAASTTEDSGLADQLRGRAQVLLLSAVLREVAALRTDMWQSKGSSA